MRSGVQILEKNNVKVSMRLEGRNTYFYLCSYSDNLSGSNGIPYWPPGMTGTLVALLSAIKLIFIAKSAIRKIWNRVHLAVKKQLKVCVNASSDPIPN